MMEASDRELVELTLRGEVSAYGTLVERYQQSVFNVCYRFMGQRQLAEDQAQEAFLRAHDRLETFKLEMPFGPWIRQVAANLCLNELKRQGPYQQPLEDEYVEHERGNWVNPEGQRQQTEQTERVRRAILGLPNHYRAVIELRHYGDMSYKEIAKSLNLPLSDVRSHLYRARQALAKELGGEDV
jgi:RNA polymerase sigma-70 factor (ECF subfamily)